MKPPDWGPLLVVVVAASGQVRPVLETLATSSVCTNEIDEGKVARARRVRDRCGWKDFRPADGAAGGKIGKTQATTNNGLVGRR